MWNLLPGELGQEENINKLEKGLDSCCESQKKVMHIQNHL